MNFELFENDRSYYFEIMGEEHPYLSIKMINRYGSFGGLIDIKENKVQWLKQDNILFQLTPELKRKLIK